MEIGRTQLRIIETVGILDFCFIPSSASKSLF